MDKPVSAKIRTQPAEVAQGRCACGRVHLEIDVPARWAWHDHSPGSRHAHGTAYATYVGSWRSRFRFTKGETHITRYEDKATGMARSFCARCGTPLTYERPWAPQMGNVPRALFESRTGREPLYHIGFDDRPDWAYSGAALAPLKGYPGVVWERPKRRKKRVEPEPMF